MNSRKAIILFFVLGIVGSVSGQPADSLQTRLLLNFTGEWEVYMPGSKEVFAKWSAKPIIREGGLSTHMVMISSLTEITGIWVYDPETRKFNDFEVSSLGTVKMYIGRFTDEQTLYWEGFSKVGNTLIETSTLKWTGEDEVEVTWQERKGDGWTNNRIMMKRKK